MEIVRSNYDSLTLKLQDGLDHYERYSEVPKEQQFFTNLVRNFKLETDLNPNDMCIAFVNALFFRSDIFVLMKEGKCRFNWTKKCMLDVRASNEQF